jgi:hypothetical protein
MVLVVLRDPRNHPPFWRIPMHEIYLVRRNDLDEAVEFADVDEEMCQHFQVNCCPQHYYKGWYGWVGIALKTGHGFDYLRRMWLKTTDGSEDQWRHLEIIDWLDANFQIKRKETAR